MSSLHIYAPLWEMPTNDYPSIPWHTHSQEQAILQLFGYDFNAEQEYPVASLRHHFDEKSDKKQIYLCADPVYLHPDRHALRLFDPPHLQVTQAEADAIMVTLNQTYADENWQFSAPTPEHWYLQLPEMPQIKTASISEAKGYDIRDFIPQGKQGKTWQVYLNEIQMLLFQHPVNEQRQATGQLPISSVWFWGAGYLPDVVDGQWTQLYHQDSFSGGLAQLQQTPQHIFQQSEAVLDVVPKDKALWVDLNFQAVETCQQLLTDLEQLPHEVFVYTQQQRLHLSLPPKGFWANLATIFKSG